MRCVDYGLLYLALYLLPLDSLVRKRYTMIGLRALAILLIKHVINRELEGIQKDLFKVWAPAQASFCRRTDASFL